jgi:LmbE family N-acetylglucosaminyl deacetylase
MSERARGGYTLVTFHAHPDDEVALTGGTIAKAAAAGHRVVLVVATLGEVGLTGEPGLDRGSLGAHRLDELQRSAALLGCARVVWLGYGDSGLDGTTDDANAFARVDPDLAAARLADILDTEGADALTIYDAAGGYGHPDHLQVHEVGRRAAALAGTPVVLEATVDRRLLLRFASALRLVPGLPPEFRPARLHDAYAAPWTITHAVDVRGHVAQKRAAMAAHTSQTTGGATPRSLSVFLRLPRFAFRWIFGREWFVEQGRTPETPRVDDIFATLRAAVAQV